MSDYGNVLRALLPPGPIWTANEGSEFAGLLEALAHSFARIKTRGLALLEEIDPRTTTELLAEWERVFGLPGDNPSPPTTTADRRAALWSKMLIPDDPKRTTFLKLAGSLGYLAYITQREYPVFVAGSPVGAPIYDRRWAYHWRLHRLSGSLDASLTWLLGSLVPDHTELEIIAPSFVERANPSNQNLNSIAHANGVWVAVGDLTGTSAYLITSTDGINWPVTRANAKNRNLYGVAFGNGSWVAVGDFDGVDAYMLRSTDNGSTWTEIPNPKNLRLRGIAYAQSVWVAVGLPDTDAYLLTSTDEGVTFIERSNPKARSLVDVAEGDGVWIAVGGHEGAYILKSSDGVNWVEKSAPIDVRLNKVAYHDGLWVAVGDSGYIVTSSDGGETWTQRPIPSAVNLRGVAYGNNLWMAVGASDGADAFVIVSFDGMTWGEWPNPKNFDLRGLAYHDQRFVAVGAADGADAYIVTLA